jgi:RNA polymerase sigma-70 factor (ECF subfamily)
MNASSALDTFTDHRQFLFGIACRILGSPTEAEDLVQEVWLRWQRQDTAEIQSPKAWLGSVMRRLCLDQLRSARHRREWQYGVQIPEHYGEEIDSRAHISAEREESLSTALTLMQQTLKPTERAVFLLREVFDYDYADAAAIVGKAEANCRQIARRAKAQLLANATSSRRPNEQTCHLVEHLVSAAATGEVMDLLALVKRDATLQIHGEDEGRAACRNRTCSHRVRGPHRSCAPAARDHYARRSGSVGRETPAPE